MNKQWHNFRKQLSVISFHHLDLKIIFEGYQKLKAFFINDIPVYQRRIKKNIVDNDNLHMFI